MLFFSPPTFSLFLSCLYASNWLVAGLPSHCKPPSTSLLPASLVPVSNLLYSFLSGVVCLSFVSTYPRGNKVQFLSVWALDWVLVGTHPLLLFISHVALGNLLYFSVSWFHFLHVFAGIQWINKCKAPRKV